MGKASRLGEHDKPKACPDDRAVVAAEESTLPESILDMICNAKKYADGRGVRMEIKRPADIQAIKTLVWIKMER